MRKESRQTRTNDVARVNGYHHGEHNRNLVFASDRPMEADSSYHVNGILYPMYGLEIETECFCISDSTAYANVLKHICFQNLHSDLIKIESDCSLNGGQSSAECITQPMTKAYIRNHYRDFKTMYEWFKTMQISCSRTGNCGMHIHISLTAFGRSKKTQDEAIRKLYYIVNKHYDLMCSLLYRDRSNTEYCGRMDYSVAKEMNLEYMSASHYNSFNGSHYRNGNVELRLVGGQKDFPCFRNTMESVFHLMEAVKTLSWKDCDDITKIFHGCNQYVYDRLKSYVHEQGNISEQELSVIYSSVVREQLI